MTVYVVDTNVAIAANRRNTHADLECQLACIEELEDVCAQQVVVIDNSGLILDEYKRHLNFSGAPGVGDKFFKHVVDRRGDESRVRQVSITQCNNDDQGFRELPKNKLDRSDRKFLAAAVVAQATILNATDSDWTEQQKLTNSLGAEVREMCPHILRVDKNHR